MPSKRISWAGCPLPKEPLEAFRARLEQAMLKSVREARLRTNWAVPRTEYEQRVAAYVGAALSPEPQNGFVQSFRRFEATLAWSGAQNGIIATVLKLTVPGVPDMPTASWHSSG
jgi:(1->4)-alpha-D-glucan 1-alpha-D-glucosylmutase